MVGLSELVHDNITFIAGVTLETGVARNQRYTHTDIACSVSEHSGCCLQPLVLVAGFVQTVVYIIYFSLLYVIAVVCSQKHP